MLDSVYLYVGVLFVCLCIAEYVSISKRKEFLFLIVLILTVVAGFRAPSVGKDTTQYYYVFDLICDNSPQLLEMGIEKSFVWLMRGLFDVIGFKTAGIIGMAFITYVCYLYRMYDYSKIANYPLMVFIFYSMYFFASMNIARQLCAVAIVFWGTRYIEKRKPILFLILVGVACIFHTSALLGLVILGVDIVEKYTHRIKCNREQFLVLICVVILIPVVICGSIYILFSYSHYFESSDIRVNIGVMLPLKLMLWSVLKREYNYCLCLERKEIRALETEKGILEGRYISAVYLLGICGTAIGYFFPYMDRIGLYFYVFEIIFWGILAESRRNGRVIKVCAIALFGYVLITEFIGNGQGTVPYCLL